MSASFTPCAAPLGNSVKQCERCKSHYCRGRRSGLRTPEISYVEAAHTLTWVPTARCAGLPLIINRLRLDELFEPWQPLVSARP